MKSVITWIMALAVMGGMVAYGFKRTETAERARAYDKRLNELKREFLTQAKGLTFIEADAYKKEVGILLAQYFRGLEDLGKAYPELYAPDREKTKTAVEAKAGKLDAAKTQARDERVDMSLSLFEKMKAGQYRPLFSAADKGFRFDIWDAQPVKSGNDEMVRFSYAHWGAFGPVSYKSISGEIKTAEQTKADADKKDAKAKVENGKKVLSESTSINADDQPPALQVDAERWVTEFVPGVEIGYYELPLFPGNAASVDLKFGFGLRTPGGSEVFAETAFNAMPIAAAWKAKGEWGAEHRVIEKEVPEAAAR
jgi:hypothetical protein